MAPGVLSDDVRFPHPLEPYPKLIINTALTGVIPTRAQTPHVPLTPEEIIRDAVDCANAGAAIVHIHARDAEGKPTYRPEIFAKIIRGIRTERPDLIICATTSGRRHGQFEERSAVLELEGIEKPDMASLTTSSLNFPDGASVNSPDTVTRLAQRMQERGIKPELEILDLGMVNAAKLLIKKGWVAPPYYFNILLGSPYTAPAAVSTLSVVLADLPARSIWSLTGIGRFQLKMNVAAILLGGHVRVGLEDNLYYDTAQTRLTTNRELVERLVRIAAEFERVPATPAEVRTMLDLLPAPRPGEAVLDRARESDVPAMLELLKTANMHHIPSPEMPEFDWRYFFVARDDKRLVGLAGWKILSETEGKTTLMVVHPDMRGRGLGLRLQTARLREMARRGVRTVTTNADLPESIAWYKKHFGYVEAGHLRKVHEFGNPNIPEWTTLKLDLHAWMGSQQNAFDHTSQR